MNKYKIISNKLSLATLKILVLVMLLVAGVYVNAQSLDSSVSSESSDSMDLSTSDTFSASGEPSLTNLTKVLTETAPEEKKKFEEEERMKTIWLIVQGAIGTILLIIAAWLLTNYARKIQKRRDEEKARALERIMRERAAKGQTKSKRR